MKSEYGTHAHQCNVGTVTYPGLVNRRRIIATLEDKAEITGYRWIVPQNIQEDFVEKRSPQGDFLYYSLVEPVTIRDVDGRDKHTIRTSYYKQDKQTQHKKPEYGVWVDGLAGSYHGRKSANWIQEFLTLKEIIDSLNAGHAFAPGYFDPPEGESHRAGDYCEHRQIALFDGDEWSHEHPAPADLDEMIARYPDLANDFYWIGESISSRSALKPELRTRLMLVFPEPIRKGQSELWETMVEAVVAKYPFIARGVGIDKVRLSFGNARPECKNRVLGGIVSPDTFAEWKQNAREKKAEVEALAKEAERLRFQRQAQRDKNNALRTELTQRGHIIVENKDPLVGFCEIDAARLLTDLGLGSHLSGKSWNWNDSSPGRSFELENGVIKPFSNTMQSASPETDGTTPVNAHRYILYYLHNLDITRDSDKHQLRCLLAEDGYGTHPDEYRKAQHSMMRAAQQEGLIPKQRTRTATIRLSNQVEYTTSAEDLETLRQMLREEVLDWEQQTSETKHPHLLILGTGAGTGKSTTVITELKEYADISPTLELADEKYTKAVDIGKRAMRHRSRNYNREAVQGYPPETVPIGLDANNGEVPCAYPDICNALAEKGYSPVKVFCQSCPRLVECQLQGYLSQWESMRHFDALFFSYQDDFFSDPKYRSYIDNIMQRKTDAYVLVLDEVDPANLPPARGYTTEHLKQVASEYRGFQTGEFLTMLIQETSTATTPHEWANALDAVMSKFLVQDLNLIDHELKGIPVQVEFQEAQNGCLDLRGNPMYHTIAYITYQDVTRRCAVLNPETHAGVFEILDNSDLDGWVSNKVFPSGGWIPNERYPKLLKVNTFIRLGFGAMDTPQAIARLPRQLGNFTAELQSFLASVNSETPACHEERDGDKHIGWTYYLQPSMNARRGVIISASCVVNIIKELYAHTEIEIDILEGKPPAWQEGCQIFQISTGRYSPARSLLDCDKKQNYKAIGLRNRGKEMLEIIAKEAENGKTTLVVGPKAFTSEGDLKHLPEIAHLLAMPNVHVINHYHAEGVNQYDHCENAFIFLFEPRPDELKSIASRIYRNDTLCFEREERRLEKAGVTLEKVQRYKDPRVQEVFDKECEKRLMQAITRLRQMIHTGKRVYLLTSEPVSSLPITPILFTMDDLKACQAEHGTLDKLETFLENKGTRRVKEIAEQDGVSERTARRRTEKQRAQAKAEIAKQAQAYQDQGLSLRKTASKMGISRRKLTALLE